MKVSSISKPMSGYWGDGWTEKTRAAAEFRQSEVRQQQQ